MQEVCKWGETEIVQPLSICKLMKLSLSITSTLCVLLHASNKVQANIKEYYTSFAVWVYYNPHDSQQTQVNK